ncbi:PTS sugar transporter subunit IIA [Bosea sp. SSUT16]|jgi:PTS system nitrogen regulatory IIA component|uniref:PTS sugar transporter subunit IIA n=1 Tax=Bosea spartocytisi TaxID=2773451 RepID=A0A927HZI1_9HYPH|nr:PTS sugar transporter subunit IIA [Bosea spartocytisi]MBD3845337.1 PTS sugar transporter subunit IIA [Bosea spartocytisi]MCT4472507.1 PTS sugar transporter subunit IIA [Bosea spartocytisi]
MTPSDIILPRSIIALSARSKGALLQALARTAAEQLALPQAAILDALIRREALGSTGVGGGVAMPHAPVPGLEQPFGLLVRLERPVAYEAIDGRPVDLVCLVLTPENGGKGRIDALACIARRLRSPEACDRIRGAASSEDIYAMLLEGS